MVGCNSWVDYRWSEDTRKELGVEDIVTPRLKNIINNVWSPPKLLWNITLQAEEIEDGRENNRETYFNFLNKYKIKHLKTK